MGRFDLILFDCDGVLIDSELIACRVTAACLTEIGFPHTTADIQARHLGRSARHMLEEVAARFGRPVPEAFTGLLAPRLRAAFEAELQPMPGIAALLDALPTPRCVASSSSPERIRHSLGCAGLLDRLAPHLYSATMVPRGKPAPDLFLHAAAAMGVPPGRCLVVEDAEPGVAAAVAAGMTAAGFTGGSHCGPDQPGRLRAAGAGLVVDQMAALQALLVRP